MIGAYSNLASFYVMALMALPAVILGLAQRPIRRYALVASVVGVVLLMSGTPARLGWLALHLVAVRVGQRECGGNITRLELGRHGVSLVMAG